MVNIKTVYLLIMIENLLSQSSLIGILKRPLRTAKGNIMWVYHCYHDTNIKTLEGFLVYIKLDFYEYELDVLPKPSADGQYKYLKYTLNSNNAFIISLVISFLGPWLKSWKCIGIKVWNHYNITLSYLWRNICAVFIINSLVLNLFQNNKYWLVWVSKFLL